MRLKNKILYISLLVLGVFALAFLSVMSIISSVQNGNGIFGVIGACFLGLILTGFLCVVLHELGHLLFGLFCGMRFKSISFPFFGFVKVNGKIRFVLRKRGDYLGFTEMYPSSEKGVAKSFAVMALGGIFGSFISLATSTVILLLDAYINDYLVFLFGVPSVIAYIILLQNAFPAVINGGKTDGAQVYEIINKTPSAKVMVAVLTMQYWLRSGLSASEAPFAILYEAPQLPDTDPNYLFLLNMKYLLALDKNDVDQIKDADIRLRDIYPRIHEVYAEKILPDLFYNNLFIIPNKNFIDNNAEKVLEILKKQDDVTACRIRGYYFVYKNDFISAFKEIEKGRALADFHEFGGVAKTEKRLLDELEVMISLSFNACDSIALTD